MTPTTKLVIASICFMWLIGYPLAFAIMRGVCAGRRAAR